MVTALHMHTAAAEKQSAYAETESIHVFAMWYILSPPDISLQGIMRLVVCVRVSAYPSATNLKDPSVWYFCVHLLLYVQGSPTVAVIHEVWKTDFIDCSVFIPPQWSTAASVCFRHNMLNVVVMLVLADSLVDFICALVCLHTACLLWWHLDNVICILSRTPPQCCPHAPRHTWWTSALFSVHSSCFYIDPIDAGINS